MDYFVYLFLLQNRNQSLYQVFTTFGKRFWLFESVCSELVSFLVGFQQSCCFDKSYNLVFQLGKVTGFFFSSSKKNRAIARLLSIFAF
jgi:hypothetical protein